MGGKKTAGLKEAKAPPVDWGKLKKDAAKADAPAGGKTWNSKRARKVGDTLCGIVGETRETMTGFGRGNVMEIHTETGAKEGVFLSAVLLNQIAQAGGFNKGDAVWIKYLGVPAGKRYVVYAVGKL